MTPAKKPSDMPGVSGAHEAMVLHPVRLGLGNAAAVLRLAPSREVTVRQGEDSGRPFELRFLDELTGGLCVARISRGGTVNLARDLAALNRLTLVIPVGQSGPSGLADQPPASQPSEHSDWPSAEDGDWHTPAFR